MEVILRQVIKLLVNVKNEVADTVKDLVQAFNKYQDQVNPILNSLSGSFFANGNFINNISLTAGQDNLIPHKLGSKYTNWMVLSPKANAVVWEGTTSQPELFINLRCSSNTTVSIYVGAV